MNKLIDLNNVKIFILDTYEEMGVKAADIFCEALNNNPSGAFGLATGSTPVSMYQELVKRYKNKQIDFSEAMTFNLDEYYPINKDNEQSYAYFMNKNLFDHININPKKINIPSGEVNDPIKECAWYEEQIKECGGIDLQVLGIGNNGHIGFNEPSEVFAKDTHYTKLTKSTIEVNARFFETNEDVPKKAITMGIKTIMQARKILLLANGDIKSKIIAKAILGCVTPSVPASVLQLHSDVTIVLDRAAAKDLIKQIEEIKSYE